MRKPNRKILGLLIFFGVACGLVVLGLLRSHSDSLVLQLNKIDASIADYIKEEERLQQELSALIAPIRIYDYCRERIGMHKLLKAETLPVIPRQNQKAASHSDNGWLKNLSAWVHINVSTPDEN